jgi:hypothetical protein
MAGSRGMMALDVVVKFVIILVVAAIVIGLFIRFSDDAKRGVSDMFDDKKLEVDFPQTVEQGHYTPGSIAQFIESCYDTMTEVPEVEQKDIVCYVLMADSQFSGFVSEPAIRGATRGRVAQNLVFQTDLSKTHLKIEFKDLGDKIIVS